MWGDYVSLAGGLDSPIPFSGPYIGIQMRRVTRTVHCHGLGHESETGE